MLNVAKKAVDEARSNGLHSARCKNDPLHNFQAF